MVFEAKEVNGQGNVEGSVAPRSSSRHLVRSLLEMGELQLQLLRADAAAATKATRLAVIFVIIAACLFIAAAPVLLLAAAEWIQETYDVARPFSLALAGGSAAIVGCILLVAARYSVNRSISLLSQSADELAQNIECVKLGLSESHDCVVRDGSTDND